MNTLFNYIPSDSFKETYEGVKSLLTGNDRLIFDAMAEVTQESRNQFTSTNDPSQFARKYREMERRFVFRSTLAGVEMGLNMMSRVYEEVARGGGVGQLQPDVLLEVLVFETNRDFRICLTDSLCWAVVWNAKLNTPRIEEEFEISVEIHKQEWGQVVPIYVVEYLDSVICAYNRGMYAAALASLSIVVEATLRDILLTRGYTFQPGASPVDVYEWGQAKVDIDLANNCYIVSFPSNMPKQVSDFHTSTQGHTPLTVQIRRKVRRHGFDLLVRSNPLVDHWSPDSISQPAQQTVGGLGIALDIARNRESVITEEDLTPDFDDVIQAVRNNLIHLSGDTLNTHLPAYDSLTPGREYTLRDFLSSPDMVFDLVFNVPQFVNEQYLKLRREGHLI
jgi:hypothetical protein